MAEDKERQEIKSRILQQIDQEINEGGGKDTRAYKKGGPVYAKGYSKGGSGDGYGKNTYRKN